jgi:tRNA(fMet)-specific endonuclease VapC
MRYLIDTDILSYFFKGDSEVSQHFHSFIINEIPIEISIITFYEILSGLKWVNATAKIEKFTYFSNQCNVLPLTKGSVRLSSDAYATLRQHGKSLDDIDLLIAGIALENEMTLVTNNTNHFSCIEGLKIESWKNGADAG